MVGEATAQVLSLNLNGSLSYQRHWHLNLQGYQTALVVLQAVGTSEGTPTRSIDDARASLSSLTHAINTFSPSIITTDSAHMVLVEGPHYILSASWLKAVSRSISLTAQPLSLILQKLASLVTSSGGKKKGKKAKASCEASTTTTTATDLSQDVKGAIGALVALLTSLEGMLRSFMAAVKPEGGGGGSSSMLSWDSTVVVGDEFKKQREAVVSMVRASHVLSCERLVDIVKERAAILRGLQ